ncbi:MAG: holo-ACP synthase [Nitrospiraceae bacterium]
MGIIGIGLDLVKIARIRTMTERWQDRFLCRLYTEEERRICSRRASPYAFLAGRFAAKEAILKALGIGWADGIRWLDIQVLNERTGRPVATVDGRVKALFQEAGITGVLISVSHDGEYAIAEALLTKDP